MRCTRTPGLVSVVVTAHNYENYVEECLNSLVQQTYWNIEIIAIDDASSDATYDRVMEWKHSHAPWEERLTMLRLPDNVGYAGAVSAGLFLARGEFIAMQDMDDVSAQTRIAEQVTHLEQRPEVSMVGANYAAFPDGQFHVQTSPVWLQFDPDVILQTYAAGGHCVCVGTVMFRGDAFDRICAMTRRIDGAEDYEFVSNWVQAGARVENITNVLYYYRSHQGQRSREFFE